MQHDLGVAAGLEDRALTNELVAQLAGVHDVAVVADGDLAVRAVDQDRLGIRELALASRRVTDVTDGQRPGQVRQLVVVERFGDVAHRPGHTHVPNVGGGDAGALLPAVLERVQAEIRHVGRLGVAEDAEDAALFPELVKHQATLRMKCRSMADPQIRSSSPIGTSIANSPPTDTRS